MPAHFLLEIHQSDHCRNVRHTHNHLLAYSQMQLIY
ncbi:hypothetical protein FSZ17_06050 [Cytobacillus dafuensis]|uniref:Uncharacterized protein n=1 Tax=Cytobacillus dafuensis TaxID=1742359 RepID=A0A5B8ZCR2_CYTDA|nr:hypothetical protein FSZ17_06050 [Cytobacillus dafuensis]